MRACVRLQVRVPRPSQPDRDTGPHALCASQGKLAPAKDAGRRAQDPAMGCQESRQGAFKSSLARSPSTRADNVVRVRAGRRSASESRPAAAEPRTGRAPTVTDSGTDSGSGWHRLRLGGKQLRPVRWRLFDHVPARPRDGVVF